MTTKKRVLIADDDQALVTALSFRCKHLGLQVQTSRNALDALALVRENPPDLILLDVNMPGGNGLAACEMLASDDRLAPIPVVMLTGRSDDETIRRCEQLGAHYVLKSVEAWPRLRSAICELLNLPATPPDDAERTAPPMPLAAVCAPSIGPRVLIINDDPDVADVLADRLYDYGVEVLRAPNGMQGYWKALEERPAVIVTTTPAASYRTPVGYANSVVGRLRHHPLTKDTPVIVVPLRRDCSTAGATPRPATGTAEAGDGPNKPLDVEALIEALRIHIDLPLAFSQPALAPVGAGPCEGGET